MIPDINNYQDWYKVETILKRMMQDHLEFMHDYNRLCKNIEVKIKDLGNIDIQLRRKESVYYRNLRKEKLKEINDTVRMFSKMLLISSLSKR